MPKYYLSIIEPLNLKNVKVEDSFEEYYKGKDLLGESIFIEKQTDISENHPWIETMPYTAQRLDTNLIIFSFISDMELDESTVTLPVTIEEIQYIRLHEKYNEVDFILEGGYVNGKAINTLAMKEVAANPVASAVALLQPEENLNIYDPASAIRRYLNEEKKLKDETIDKYVNGTSELPRDKGVVRAVHFLQWLTKQNISNEERHLINYVLLTHEYKSLRFLPNFLGSLVIGILREMVWKEYQALSIDLSKLGLSELPQYFYENELKFIIEAYARNDIGDDVARKNLEAFKSRVGGLIDAPGFCPENEPITHDDIQALVTGELLPSQKDFLKIQLSK